MQLCTSFCKERIAEFRSNFPDVTLSSMRNRTEYLIKYSIAPPPSRDYYGLKIFEDEVILYLWKISHGPHKAPIVYRVKLNKFDQEKSLQNEIRYGFGKYLLKHVKNIADGNRNLLTLPNSVIGKISKYLKFTDILKLSSLSHIAYEVFNTDLVWQILYTRDKKANISLKGKEKIIIYDWKQLYKDNEMQASIKNQTNHQISSLTIDHAKTNKLLMKPISDAPKSTSNKTSTTKKCSNSSVMALVTIPLSISDTRFRTYTNKNEKPCLQKKDIKNTSSKFNMNEKNVKKDLITSKMTTKQEIKSVSKHNKIPDKQINETIKSNNEKCSNKINNINTKSTTSTQKSKLKCKTQTASKTSISKNIVGNLKSSPVSNQQNLHNKTQSQAKSKPKKKITVTKSETFNIHEELSKNPFIVKHDKVDLDDLIEANLKKIRSPRSIFDYDFSCIEQSNRTKDILGIRNEIQNIDKSKQLKLIKNSVDTNNFSHKIIRDDEISQKLSEKSKIFNEASNESFDKKFLSREGDKPISLSEKYIKAREELRKSLEWNRSDLVSSQDRWDPDINFQNKSCICPRKIVNNNEKSPIPKRSLKTSFL